MASTGSVTLPSTAHKHTKSCKMLFAQKLYMKPNTVVDFCGLFSKHAITKPAGITQISVSLFFLADQ
jgi:hypothetical protein